MGIFSPVFYVFIVMAGSWALYNVAWRINNDAIHQVIANISGTLLFLSVTFSTFLIYPMVYMRGGSLGERIIASLINPFLWATKECIRLYISFTPLECLYYYLNPLNIWLLFGITAQMGIAEIFCRLWLRAKGKDIRVLSPYAVGTVLISLFLVVLMYAWGQGENVYVLFLKGYRLFFGSGVKI